MTKDIVMKALRTQIEFNEKKISEMKQGIDKLEGQGQSQMSLYRKINLWLWQLGIWYYYCPMCDKKLEKHGFPEYNERVECLKCGFKGIRRYPLR